MWATMLAWSLVCGARAFAADPPDQPLDRRHLFYLHGAWIEEHGLFAPHPDYGRYEYAAITRALAAAGFTVISEPRLRPVEIGSYAREIVRRIEQLIEQGVRADAITVAGHSKGAKIALAVAAELGSPQVRFVVMAGCPRGIGPFRTQYRHFVETEAPRLQGRILSVYDKADAVTASCSEAFARADATRAKTREVVLDTGRGHGLFYAPAPVWIDEIVEWSRAR